MNGASGDALFATRTDHGATEWRINDDVVRLREWGTDIIHRLPQPPWESAVMGTAETCSLQLVDPSGYTSREHARLDRGPSGWTGRDLACAGHGAGAEAGAKTGRRKPTGK